MSMSISNEIKEDKISFNKKSIFIVGGEELSTGETYKASTGLINKKCEYLKVLANISVDDDSITTDDFHPVVVLFEIKYEDDDGNHSLIHEHFYPKYQHEVLNKDTYTIIELKNKKLVDINVEVINNEDYTDSVIIDKIQIFYSLIMDEETIQEMISTGGGGTVPVFKDLVVYNIDNNYTIDGYDNSLILDVEVPENYLKEYKNSEENDVYIIWDAEALTEMGTETYSIGIIDRNVSHVVNGVEYHLYRGRISIKPWGYVPKDGFIKVRARLEKEEKIYGETIIEIKNSEVKDIYIKSISSEDGKLHVERDVTIELGYIPEKSRHNILGRFELKSYDGKGKANNVYGNNEYDGGTLESSFKLRGVSEGKVSLYLGRDDGVHKQFIFDVVDNSASAFEIISDTGVNCINTGDGELGYSLKEDYEWFKPVSFSLISLDGSAIISTSNKNEGTVKIVAKKNGQVKLVAKSYNNIETSVIIDITGQYPEDVTINSDDGTYKVNVGSQLALDIQPTNKCSTSWDKYNNISSKIDTGVNYDISYSNYGKTLIISGKEIGKFNLSIQRTVDSKILRSQVIEVVNEKYVNIPLPEKDCYWALVKRKNDNRYLLCYIDNVTSQSKFIYEDGNIKAENTFNKRWHYWLNDFKWQKSGEWDWSNDYTISEAMYIYESNLDVYDTNGNLLVARTPSWEDVNIANLNNKLKD